MSKAIIHNWNIGLDSKFVVIATDQTLSDDCKPITELSGTQAECREFVNNAQILVNITLTKFQEECDKEAKRFKNTN